jgi:hypothetical protein
MQPEEKSPLSSIGRLFSRLASCFSLAVRFHPLFAFHVVVFVDVTMSVRCNSVATPTALACMMPSAFFCVWSIGRRIHTPTAFVIQPHWRSRDCRRWFATKADVGMQPMARQLFSTASPANSQHLFNQRLPHALPSNHTTTDFSKTPTRNARCL